MEIHLANWEKYMPKPKLKLVPSNGLKWSEVIRLIEQPQIVSINPDKCDTQQRFYKIISKAKVGCGTTYYKMSTSGRWFPSGTPENKRVCVFGDREVAYSTLRESRKH